MPGSRAVHGAEDVTIADILGNYEFPANVEDCLAEHGFRSPIKYMRMGRGRLLAPLVM